MLKVSHLFIILAITILVAHTVIPHVHHKQLSENEDLSEHNAANSFLDYVKLALHTDPGSDHLEDFFGSHFTFHHFPGPSGLPVVRIDQSPIQLLTLAPVLFLEQYISPFLQTGAVTRGPPMA